MNYYPLSNYLKKYIYHIFLLIFFALLSNLSMLSLIPISKNLTLIFKEKSLIVLYNLAILVIILYILRGLFFYIQNVLASYISIKTTSDLRKSFYNNFLNTSYINIENKKSEEIIFTFSNDLLKIKDLIYSVLSELFPSLILFSFSVIYAFYINWKLFLLVIILIPVISFILSYTNKILETQSSKIQKKNEELLGHLNESIINYKILKIFDNKISNFQKLEYKDSENNKENLKLARVVSLQPAITGVVQTTGISIIIYYGASQVINGQISLENLLAFGTALSLTIEPAIFITKTLGIINVSKVSIKRFFDLYNYFEVEKDTKKDVLLELEKIKIENLSFGYKDISILYNLSFELEKGDWLYISGDNGSGKSTLIKILLGLYKNYQGNIIYNDKNLNEYDLSESYKQIKVSFHESYLFNGSILENILNGEIKKRDNFDIETVSKISKVSDIISEHSEGYKYNIGELGNNLSTGQKQRIAIARALISKPSFLILDEASSAIDQETEKIIYENIKKYLPNTIVILINHRKGSDIFTNKQIYL